MKHKHKKLSKIFIIVTSVILICTLIYLMLNIVFSPYWGSIYAPDGYLSFNSFSAAESDELIYTNEQARDDIDYILKYLRRVHPKYKDGLPDSLINLAEQEKNSFGEEVSTYELWRAAAGIMSSVGDAHTMVAPSFARHYLCELITFTDDYTGEYDVLSVNGKTIEDLFNENNDLFSYELESWGVISLKNCLQTLEGMKFLGIDTSDLTIDYIDSKGSIKEAHYTDKDFLDYESAGQILTNDEVVPYEYKIDEENNVGVITLNSCDYNDEYKEFLYNFFSDVIDKDIDNVVVDLSKNTGGNSQVANEFILYLNEDTFKTGGGVWRLGPYMMSWDSAEDKIAHYDDMLYDGCVYVITSGNTFSSATLFAEYIADNEFGMIVGNPCGNMPQSYGDIAVFQTPNAKLSFQISTKYFKRIDENKAYEPLLPDYECTPDEAMNIIYGLAGSKK